MGLVTIGSRKITTAVPTVNGKEHVVEFVNGIANVTKDVKDFLLKNSPGMYFDPDKSGGEGIAFSDEFEALRYYISMAKAKNPPKLCSMLKGEYESLQGDLMSGKYNQKQENISPQAVSSGVISPPSNLPIEKTSGEQEIDEEGIEEFVTGGAGDSINPDDGAIKKGKKKKKKKKKKKEKVLEEVEEE